MAVFRDETGRREVWLKVALGVLLVATALWFAAFVHTVLVALPRAAQRVDPSHEVLIAGTGERFTWDGLTHTIVRTGGAHPGQLALSFDDGPDPATTPRVLDLLRARHLHAAFFVIGAQALKHPDLVRRIRDEGHLLGNHTFTHHELAGSSPSRVSLELGLTQRALAAILGEVPTLLRPPFHADGALDEPENREALALALQPGLSALGQDVDSEDFRGGDPRAIAARTLARAQEAQGGLALFHDGGGDRASTLAALPLVLDGLASRGLEPVDAQVFAGLDPKDSGLAPAASDPVERATFWLFGHAAAFCGAIFQAALVLLSLRLLLLAGAALVHLRRLDAGAAGANPLRVSAVVPAYNEEVGAVRTVESLLAQQPPLHEVLCIDDGSSDGTFAALQRAFAAHPRVRVLTQRNQGKSAALVRGFSLATGDVVIALDGDTLFAPGAAQALVAPFSNPRVAGVAGNAKVGNRVSPIACMQALEYVTAQNLERRAWDLLGCVPCIPGAVGAWRRQAVLDAGGFTSDTLAEDTDLTLRLLARGHEVVYADTALAFTEAPETARALHKQRFRWTFGVLQAAYKHRDKLCRRGAGPLGWLLLPSIALFQLAVPLCAPLVDVLAALSLALGDWRVLVPLLSFLVLDACVSALAVWLDREDPRLVLWVPLQRFVFRWVLWAALVKALASAVSGSTVGWGKLARTGSMTMPAWRAVAA